MWVTKDGIVKQSHKRAHLIGNLHLKNCYRCFRNKRPSISNVFHWCHFPCQPLSQCWHLCARILSKTGVYFAMLNCLSKSAHVPTLILGVQEGGCFYNVHGRLFRKHRNEMNTLVWLFYKAERGAYLCVWLEDLRDKLLGPNFDSGGPGGGLFL